MAADAVGAEVVGVCDAPHSAPLPASGLRRLGRRGEKRLGKIESPEDREKRAMTAEDAASAARCDRESGCRRGGRGTIIPKASRVAHGAAYGTYVGSWRSRFRIVTGLVALAVRGQGGEGHAEFCAACGTPLFYEQAHAPQMVNFPRALFESGAGREPLYRRRRAPAILPRLELRAQKGQRRVGRWCGQ